MHSLLLTKKTEKELQGFETSIRKRIVEALDELKTLSTSASNIKKLQTPFPGFRKRVGDYRILFEVNETIIVVYKIDKRADVYR
jgi:mRNA interferase RelE/StbE